MSIIVQAGHETSKSKQLMEKLYERGLSRPADSYTHKMTPEQVSETLYKVFAREDMSSANEKMADNVMIDFLLANLDSENWGWESDKNLASLEYWGQIESDVRFILVFDHPSNILKEFADVVLTTDMVDQAMNEWVDYHQEVLRVLETHEKKAILVEGICAVKNISNLGKQIKYLANTLQLKSSWQILGKKDSSLAYFDMNKNEKNDVVSEHIVDETLRKYPEVIEVFNKLLSKATIKCSDQIYKTKRTELDSLISALNYLKEHKDNQKHLLENKKLNEEVDSIKNISAQKIGLLEAKYKEAVLEKNETIEQLQKHQRLLEVKNLEIEKYQQQKLEDKILEEKLDEVNKTKYEIEKKNLENQKLINQYKAELDQLRKLKTSTDISVYTESLKKENDMLIKQLYRTQEELEKYYLKSQPQLSTLSDKKDTDHQHSKPEAYYGAAERVKSELAYRIGERMVKARKPKDIIALPLVLAKEYQKYEIKKEEFYNLPDIKEYNDFDEGRKVKEHLSYRIGSLFLNTPKSPVALLMMPLNVGKEVVSFRMKRKK